jgi:hypothetical protein
MTEDEMRRFAERHGLMALRAEDLARMAELSVRVAATGLSIARMPEKSDEPAGVFRVPLSR